MLHVSNLITETNRCILNRVIIQPLSCSSQANCKGNFKGRGLLNSVGKTNGTGVEISMKRKMITVAGVIAVVFGVYFLLADGEESTPIADEAQDIQELVEDYSANRDTDDQASITSHQLIVTDTDENESAYDLPEDEFFVSIAPFIEETHPCAVHSLTGCQGEMVDEAFDVYIEDEDGSVVVDESLQSLDNGFIDIWLPRDKTYSITIAYEDKTVESEFSTFEDDDTCITTMQLV